MIGFGQPRSNRLSPTISDLLKAGLALTFLTLATRAWTFGNPLIGLDEQFYLTIADRLWQGDLLYVDLWDRKPIGLFLIYAFAVGAFRNPVIAYQLLAVISIVATACVLFVMARRVTSFASALAGAAVYPAWVTIFSGMGGQASLFYTLPMVAAAAMTLLQIVRVDRRGLTARGCAIMLLTGIAIQIKYTVIFEGIFFGLTLLWSGWKNGRPPARLAGDGLVWVASALLPTFAAAGWYFAQGHGAEFIETNFISIFGDKDPSMATAFGRLAGLTVGVSPFIFCAWLAMRHWWRSDADGAIEARWILGWAGTAFLGFLVYGVWFDFYVLPLLAPFGLVAALAFDLFSHRWRAIAVIVGLGVAGGVGRTLFQLPDPGTAQELDRLQALAQPHLGRGCIYVNEGLPILYQRTRSCLPSHYLFPEHLTGLRYQYSLGVDQLGELDRTLASRPAVIVMSLMPDDDTRPEARALLERYLHRNYSSVGTVRVGSIRYEIHALRQDVPGR